MARVVINGFPDGLYRELKIEAVRQGITVKALIITATIKVLGNKYDPETDGLSEPIGGKQRKAGAK